MQSQRNVIGDCLVFRKDLPTTGELVICVVERITPFAAWCNIEEYNIEGMIHISEVAGKWIHDIREFVKLNKQYVAKVVRIDQDKNLVNLSLKRVSKREEKGKLNDFRKEQRAEKILEIVGKELNKTLKQSYEEVGFLLQENFGSLFNAFEEIRRSKDSLEKIGMPKNWANALSAIIEKNFKEKELVLKVEIELKSYAEDGVERVKKVLSGLTISGAVISYISAPKYRLELKTTDPKNAEKNLKEKLEAMIKSSKTIEVEGIYRFVK